MTAGNVVAVGATSGFVVWITWVGGGRAVWLASRIRREIDDRLWKRDEKRAQDLLDHHRDDLSPVENDLRERQRCIDSIIQKAEELGTDLEEFASSCADLAPTAADIAALRFFDIDDWTAAA